MRWSATRLGVLFGAGTWIALALPAVEAALSWHDARSVRAIAAARADAPRQPPAALVAPGLTVEGGSGNAAAAAMAARIRKLAAGGGVLVEAASRGDAGPGLTRLRVRLSGPANAVIALADSVERDAPLTRFASWRVTALADGGVRLEGELVGAWR
jgi:hypothetical protein